MASGLDISENFQISTAIRYESGLLKSQPSHDGIADRFMTMSDFYLLAFHQDKVMNAAKHFHWPIKLIQLYSGSRGLQLLFAKLLLHIHEDQKIDGPLQIHLALAKDGKLNIRSSPALQPGLLFPVDLFDNEAEPQIRAFGVLYQRTPIQVVVGDQGTSLSGSRRSSILQSSYSSNASPTQEQLIISQYGEVLEGEFTTPYFARDGVWTTPAFSGVVTESVTRRYAVEHRLCREGIILKSSLKHGEQCWLSDGIRGFFRGTIYNPPPINNSSPNRSKENSDHDSTKSRDSQKEPEADQTW
jgi:4-amino-4-deoxychorismate lyase